MTKSTTASTIPSKGGISHNKSIEVIEFLADGCGANESEREIVKALHNGFRAFSDWNAQHSIRVGLLSSRLAAIRGWSPSDAARLGLCSCLHDIGKLGVPSEILEKSSELTPAEREIINEHVIHGLTIMNGLRSSFQSIANLVIEHHHENFDGTGYPHGLKGAEIQDEMAIVRLVDFYDAVYFDRPYRPGLNLQETISLLQAHSDKFEPDHLAALQSNINCLEDIT